jgi:hypothetical protein
MRYATSRKVAGSSPDEVTKFFFMPNPSSLIMALGLTHPLTEVSIRNTAGGQGRPEHKADKFTDICGTMFWEPRRLTLQWASTAC